MNEPARRCADHVRAAKALCASARRVAGLQQQLLAALAQLGSHMSAVYGADTPESAAACESCAAVPVCEACAALKAGEHLRPAEAFARAWADAERWLADAARALKGAGDDAAQCFAEQRFDGLDAAACAFVRLVQATLPPSGVAACTLRRSLASTQRVADVYPTAQDGGAAAATGLSALLGQRVAAQYLRMFLASRLTEETLDFCLAVLALQAAAAENDADELSCLAQEIVARYVAPSAPHQINVSDTTREALAAAARAVPVDVAAFVGAKNELVQAMECGDTHRQFVASPFYARLVRRLTPVPWLSVPLPTPTSLRAAALFAMPRRLSAAALVASPGCSPPEGLSPRAAKKRGHKAPSALRVDLALDARMTPPEQALASPTAALFGGPLGPATPGTAATGTAAGVSPRSVLGQLRARSKNPCSLVGPTMDDITSTPELLRSFQHFLYEKGADRPLEFYKAATTLLRKRVPSPPPPPRQRLTSTAPAAETSPLAVGDDEDAALRLAAAHIYEEYLVPRAEDVPLGVPYDLRRQLYSAVYDTDAPCGAWAGLLQQACDEVLHTLCATEHPLYTLSERWRPLWSPRRAGSTQAALTPSALLAARLEPSSVRARARSMTTTTSSSSSRRGIIERRNSGARPLVSPLQHSSGAEETPQEKKSGHARASSLEGERACAFGGDQQDRSSSNKQQQQKQQEQSHEDASSGGGQSACLCAAQELKTRLQTVFLPCLQRIASSVKAIASAEDLAPHQGELQALFAVLKLLGDVAVPATLKAPSFAHVAAAYPGDEQLALFMTKVHRCVWEATAKIAGIIHALDKAAAAHSTDWALVSRFWDTYERIYEAVAHVQ